MGTPNSQSRVMKVPIRVYNHVSGGIFSVSHDGADGMSVSVGQPSRGYDLLLGSAGQDGKLEEKIEERSRDSSKCTLP